MREKITAFKQDFANRFNSKYALRVFPHITLKAPFRLPANAHEELLRWFADLHVLQNEFTIQLKNFGAFEKNRNPVIYINVIESKNIFNLQQQLMASFSSFFPNCVHPLDIKFKPHSTVAYKDLTREMFSKAWSEYQHKQFDASFEVDAIYLLQHDSKKWNIIATHNLKQEVAL
ncbi:MAG TPA: 2'-5' RNA ligase family protein [Parafilimonas sp.]|nr:2'-5' RNA ligase family protein [Parafilimonas sp.]